MSIKDCVLALPSALMVSLIAFAWSTSAQDAVVLTPTNETTVAAGGAMVPAADGRSLFLVEQASHVNVWGLLVYRWPEVVGSLFLVVGVWLIGRAWRRSRMRREAGEPYCRRCQYRLSGLASDKCPECGSDLSAKRAVVIAPRPWSARRRWIVLTTLVLFVGGVTAVGVDFSNRRPQLMTHPSAGWFQWNSRALHELAVKHDFKWLLLHGDTVSIVVERRATDGARVREFEGYGDRDGPFPLVLSPDGKLLWAADTTRLRSWDVATGKPRHTLQCPPLPHKWGWRHARLWIGTDGILAKEMSSGIGKSELAAWNLATGEPTPIASEVRAATEILTATRDGLHVLVRSDDSFDSAGKYPLLDYRTGQKVGPGIIHVPLNVDAPLMVRPNISADGKRLFDSSYHRTNGGSPQKYVKPWSMTTGGPLPTVGPFDSKRWLSSQVLPLGDGSKIVVWQELLVSSLSNPATELEVWDADASRKLATLSITRLNKALLRPMPSLDGKTLVVAQVPLRTGKGGSVTVSLFDLSSLWVK